jgi:hypothetical protein
MQAQIRKLLKELRARHDTGILKSTTSAWDRVVVMRRVRIVECGLFSAVARPQNPASATSLASFVPILPSQRQRCRAPALGRLTVQHHDAHAMPLIGTTSSQDERPQTNTFPVKGGGPVDWRTYSTRAVQCASRNHPRGLPVLHWVPFVQRTICLRMGSGPIFGRPVHLKPAGSARPLNRIPPQAVLGQTYSFLGRRFRIRTPGPPPFSSMYSTPADSRGMTSSVAPSG